MLARPSRKLERAFQPNLRRDGIIDQRIQARIAEGLEHLVRFIGTRADMAARKRVRIRKRNIFKSNSGRSRRILRPRQIYHLSSKHRKKLRAAIRKSSEI